MNWGYKIAFAYGSFVIMILYFLFVASSQTNDLVEDHYYEKEMQFQNVLNANQNLADLNIKPIIEIAAQQVNIKLPSQVGSNVENGKIEFMRMADKSGDLEFAFNTDENGNFSLPVEKFHKGVYQMKMQWQDHGKQYMHQDQFDYRKP
jgi:nitrogen fixation protein FixH